MDEISLFDVYEKYDCFYTEIKNIPWFVDKNNFCERYYYKAQRDNQLTEDFLKYIKVYSTDTDDSDIPVCQTDADEVADRLKPMMKKMTDAVFDKLTDENYYQKFVGYMTNIINGNAPETLYEIAGKYIQQ